MSRRVVTLQQLVRRGELYGTECLYETAEWDLAVSTEDLGRLALHLRRIDPNWKLSWRQRDRLIYRLLDVGWPDKRIRASAKVGATTFRTLKTQWARGEPPQIWRGRQIAPDPAKTSIDFADVSSW